MLVCEDVSALRRKSHLHNDFAVGSGRKRDTSVRTGCVRRWVPPSDGLAVRTECHVFARKWSHHSLFIVAPLLLLLGVASAVTFRARSAAEPSTVPFSDLLGHIERADVTSLVVSGDTLDFTLSSGRT